MDRTKSGGDYLTLPLAREARSPTRHRTAKIRKAVGKLSTNRGEKTFGEETQE
jgi:hypothetical protein